MKIRCARRAFVALLTLGAVIGVARPGPVSAQTANATELEGCVAQTHSLSVLFLVDTSQSLQQSDPTAQRVSGIRAALNTLATQKEAADRSGEGLDVFVDFISFGTGSYRTFEGQRPPWAPLDPGDAQLEELIGGFAAANTAVDTDYVSAFSPAIPGNPPPDGQIGALESLSAAPANSCRLVVWFTDGEFDFDFTGEPKTLPWFDPPFVIDSDGTTVEAALHGVKRLCDPGGLADRLRSGPISNGEGAQLALVALEQDGGSDALDLARSIAVGQSGSTSCGTAPARGEEFSAGSVSDLLSALVTVTNGQPDAASPPDLGSCDNTSQECDDPTKLNADYDFVFYLPSNVSTFNLLAFAADPEIDVELITPDAEVIPLREDTALTARNGALITVDTFAQAAGVKQVTATLPPEGRNWAGLWAVRFRTSDPARVADLRNRASIYVYTGETRAVYRSREAFARRGFSTEFTIGVVNSGGVIVTQPEYVPSPELSLTINGQPVDTPEPNDDGTWTFRYDVPADFQPDQLDVVTSLSAYIQLAPDQPPIELRIADQTPLEPIQVRSTPPFPFVQQADQFATSADQLDHTSIETTIHIDAEADDSGGCVSLEALSVAPVEQTGLAPELSVFDGDTMIEPGAPCSIELADGESRDLRVVMSFNPDEIRALGVGMRIPVDAQLTFVSTSAVNPDDQGTFDVPLQATVEPAENIIRPPWWFVVLMTLISAAFPLVLMYLANFASAKVTVGTAGYARLDVRLHRGRLKRADGSPNMALRPEEFHPSATTEGSYRRLDYQGIEFKGVMPRSPFNDVGARASIPDKKFVVGPRGSTATAGTAIINPVLTSGDRSVWIFAADDLPERVGDTVEPIDATITLLVPLDFDAAQRQVAAVLGDIAEVVSVEAARHAVERPPSAGDRDPHQAGGTDVSSPFGPAVQDPTAPMVSPFFQLDDASSAQGQAFPDFARPAADEMPFASDQPAPPSGMWKRLTGSRSGSPSPNQQPVIPANQPWAVPDQTDRGLPDGQLAGAQLSDAAHSDNEPPPHDRHRVVAEPPTPGTNADGATPTDVDTRPIIEHPSDSYSGQQAVTSEITPRDAEPPNDAGSADADIGTPTAAEPVEPHRPDSNPEPTIPDDLPRSPF